MEMPMVNVYSFKIWDNALGDYVVQPRKSTAERIGDVRGAILSNTREEVDSSALDAEGRYDSSRSGA